MVGEHKKSDYGPIPKKWREAVVRILREGAPGSIHTTSQSRNDWSCLFPFSFGCERYESMANALRVDCIEGRRIYGMREEGEVYAFFFYHKETKIYGKINLLSLGRLIIIYSSHRPEKGNKL